MYKLRRTTIIYLILIIIFAFVLRFWFVPHTFQVYDDEHIYHILAKNFLYHNKYCDTPLGTSSIENFCNRSNYPPGQPFILSLVMISFGNKIINLFFYSIIISTISIFLFFYLTYTIFRNEKMALISALLLATLPVHLRLSGSIATEITSIFFLLLTLLCAFNFIERKGFSIFLVFLFSLLFLVQIRIENILFVFIMTFLFFILKDRFKQQQFDYLVTKKTLILIFIFFLLLIPMLINISQMNIVLKKEDHDIRIPKFSLSIKDHMTFFKQGIKPNLIFWFDNKINPIIITILSGMGFVFLWKDKKKLFYFLSLFFLVFFILYNSYHKDLIFSFGRDFRHTLNLYVPMLLLSSYGLHNFFGDIVKKKFMRYFGLSIIIFLIILNPFFFREFIEDNSFPMYSEFEFLLSIKEEVPKNCDFFSERYAPLLSIFDNKVSKIDELFLENFSAESKCSLFYMNSYVPNSYIIENFILENYVLEKKHSVVFSDGNKFELSLVKPKI